MSVNSINIVPPSGHESPEFTAYSELLSGLNATHPQHQGFIEEAEFNNAASDPRTVSLELSKRGKSLLLPQLCSVDSFEWLNEDYYRGKFPTEFASGSLMHFMDFPGIPAGSLVRAKITDIATEDGVLVYDFPSTAQEVPSRIRHLVGELGLLVVDDQVLGTQTYFAGKTHFKIPTISREIPLSFSEANAIFKARGDFDEAQYVDGTTMQDTVVGDEADRMFEFYSAAYAKISDHPCVQGLSPEEFRHVLDNPLIPKIIYRSGGVAESLMLLTNNLDPLTWVNSGYYKEKFPEKYEKGKVTWFPGIATDPDPNKVGHNMPKLVGLAIKLMHIADNDFVVVFDTPDVNTEFLPAYLKQEIDKTPELGIDFETLGHQEYRAIRLANPVK